MSSVLNTKKVLQGLPQGHSSVLKQSAWPGNIRQLRSTIQTAVALTTTDKLELGNFRDIYPEFVQTLISVWHTLPPETQHAIWETLRPETQHTMLYELSAWVPRPSDGLDVSYIQRIGRKVDALNIRNMNQHQILRAVAQKRIEQYTSLREAGRIVRY